MTRAALSSFQAAVSSYEYSYTFSISIAIRSCTFSVSTAVLSYIDRLAIAQDRSDAKRPVSLYTAAAYC